MRRRLHQIPKGSTQQQRIPFRPPDATGSSSLAWTGSNAEYSIPQASYLDRVPWHLNETTCQPDFRFAHGRGCLQLIQTFAKSEGQNLSHVRVPGGTPLAPEYVGAGYIHDYSPQGNHCTYSHTERRGASQYRVGYRQKNVWGLGVSNGHEPRALVDDHDSVWGWRSIGSSVPGANRHPVLTPSKMLNWIGSGDDYRGAQNEFTFHAYASWQGRGQHPGPETTLFSMSSSTDDTFGVNLRIGQTSAGYLTARLKTDSYYYEDDEEGDYESQQHVATIDTLADGRFHLISVVFDGRNDQVRLYSDGQRIDAGSGLQYGNLMPGDHTESIWLAERKYSQVGAWTGGFAWGGLWGFAWDDNQIRRLGSDVYGLFRMLERPAPEVETSEEDANAGTAAATAQALDAGYSLDLGVGVAVSDAVGLTASGQAVVPDTLLKQNQFHLKQNDNLNPLGIF